MQAKVKLGWFAVVAMLATASAVQAADLIPLGSSWKYFLGTQEASAPTDAWRAIVFSDTTWPNGTAPIGYDTQGTPGTSPIVTTLPDPRTAGNPLWNSTYFRKTFNVANPAAVTDLVLTVFADDGAVAWVNGEEVGRINVPGGNLAYNGAAVAADETRTLTTTNIVSKLVAGNNVVTVHVFNGAAASSDFVFEALLTATLDEAPTVTSLDPLPSSIVTSLSFVDVVFSESVTGVDASDLRINGVPAASMTVISPREYVFNFPEPATGMVSVAWIALPGIADTDQQPDLFVPGPGWTYTLDPNVIPASAIISEFMADNENGIIDEDGDREDWIEILNPGLVDISLQGWYLTDTRVDPLSPSSITNLTKWRLPNVVLGPGKYLLVWASGKNRINPAAPLHTNFRLSSGSGGYLALVDPQTNVVSSFDPYPSQVADTSYGRDRIDPNIVGYFTTPTPRAQNSTSGSGFAPAPALSLESGVYTNASLSLVITVPPGTTVRYTTDGSLPTTASTAYVTPLVLQNNTTIKVRAFPTSGGLFPSAVQVRNFLFLDASTRDFSSNLPVLVLSSEGRAILQSVVAGFPRTKGSFFVFDTFRGRSSFSRKPDYVGPADLEVFGQTSAGFPKQPYNIEIQDALGNDKKESILGMPAEADWKLRNPYSDKCLMNDFLAYELFEQMGNYSVRRKFVEVFVDSGGGRLSYPGDYIGVEVFLEKIERGDDRVDIAELTPAHTNEPSITGGFMFKKDKDSTGDLNFSAAGQGLKLHEPKPQSMRNAPSSSTTSWPGAGYTPSASNQMAYLVNYLNGFNTAMNATDWLTRTGTNHYSHYIDVDSFVDSHWIVEFPKQIDGYRISNFFRKDRNGKIKNAPVWDWNLAFGNANYLDGGHTNEWYYSRLNDAGAHIWLSRLVGGTQPIGTGTAGDPDFIQKIIDRWGVLRTNVMNGDRLVARIDEIATLLNEAAARNFSKYNYLNSYQWPNPEGSNDQAGNGSAQSQQRPWDVDYVQPTYAAIISEMKKWTKGRYLWIDGQFPKGPNLSIPEGDIAAGASLVISAPAGTIYYTLDGSDPRRSQAAGAVSPTALTYSAPVTLNDNARVFARARVGTVWSPPAIATYVAQRPRLVITEIMYHPAPPPAGSPYLDEDFEYVELRNVGAGTLNVNGYTISGGIDFTITNNFVLTAGQRVLVVKNQAAFISRYGSSFTIAGQYTGNLANNVNRLVLKGKLKEPLLDFSYSDAWYPITDGFGFSLVIVNDAALPATWGLSTSWRPSGVLNGTPGQGDGAAPTFPQVVINEALTHSDPPPPTDTVELRNLTAAPVNIGGWFLSDDFNSPKKYRIVLGTTIPASGYLTFNESQFNSGAAGNTPFALSSSGDDEIYLFSADTDGNLTGYYHGFSFGPAKNGVTFGRHVTSTGEERFVSQATPTLGAANSGPLVGPVVVSEIMYRPTAVFANGAYWNNEEDELVELRNITGSPVALFDPARQTNTWKLDKAVEFQFPASTTLAAGGYLLVVNFNPATDPVQLGAFRTKYGIGAGVPIFGPYKGNLANGDETVALYLPDNPETSGANAGQIPYVLVDEVRYSDQAPWPVAADGLGHALHRLNVSAYGDDPVNWAAGAPTPGAGFVGGTSPTVTAQPSNLVIPATATATFTGGAVGPGPLRFQWRFNGEVLNGATNSTLVIPNVQIGQGGQYQLFVLNPFGFAVSSTATLTVLIPANISQQPVDQKVAEGGNAFFSVIASSVNPPLTYQWYFNDQPLPEQTSATLTLNNVISDVHDGTYTAVLTDASGSIASAPAKLTVLLTPRIISPIPGLNLTAVAGESVSFGSQLRGTKPMWVQWRKFSAAGVNQGLVRQGFINENQDFFSTNASATAAGIYTLQFTNIAGGSLGSGTQRTNAILVVLADSNSNGIPDQWESDYFGSATGANRDVDSDGDGMSNGAEYTAGTNPTNAASYLKVGDIDATTGASITFQAVAKKTYTVEYKDGIDSVIWNRLADVAPLDTDWTPTVVDPTPGTNRYYRLITPRRQ